MRSSSSTLLNARLGWRPSKQLELVVDVLNLTDRKVSDIDYYYASRLAGETDPVAGIHTHPAEPRTVRVGLRWTFG